MIVGNVKLKVIISIHPHMLHLKNNTQKIIIGYLVHSDYLVMLNVNSQTVSNVWCVAFHSDRYYEIRRDVGELFCDFCGMSQKAITTIC